MSCNFTTIMHMHFSGAIKSVLKYTLSFSSAALCSCFHVILART